KNSPVKKTRPLNQCGDVYGLLEQIRLRPSLWLPDRSLRDLQNILIGYDAALTVNGLERAGFWPSGPFSDRLHARYGWSTSSGRLEQLRLRRSLWLPDRSLRNLQTILTGYVAALTVNGLERSGFWPSGPFSDRLHARYGWSTSTGWAGAIERNAGPEEPLQVF